MNPCGRLAVSAVRVPDSIRSCRCCRIIGPSVVTRFRPGLSWTLVDYILETVGQPSVIAVRDWGLSVYRVIWWHPNLLATALVPMPSWINLMTRIGVNIAIYLRLPQNYIVLLIPAFIESHIKLWCQHPNYVDFNVLYSRDRTNIMTMCCRRDLILLILCFEIWVYFSNKIQNYNFIKVIRFHCVWFFGTGVFTLNSNCIK